MKVIELLNKIANGEEVPERIIYGGIEWAYKDRQYYRVDGEHVRNIWSGYNFNILNDEVEIIEEDKKIEKIETYDEDGNIFIDEQCFKYVPIDKYCLTDNEKVFVDKINKIIDYLKEKE